MRSRLLAPLLLTAALASFDEAQACPNCKEAVAAQPSNAAALARGYNGSILVMAAMPFVLLGTGAWLVTRAAKAGLFPEF